MDKYLGITRFGKLLTGAPAEDGIEPMAWADAYAFRCPEEPGESHLVYGQFVPLPVGGPLGTKFVETDIEVWGNPHLYALFRFLQSQVS